MEPYERIKAKMIELAKTIAEEAPRMVASGEPDALQKMGRMVELLGLLTDEFVTESRRAGLQPPAEQPNVFSEHMTPAAIEARNKAISETKAEGDPLIKAIHKAGYSGLNAYAAHLKVSPGSLVAYRDGIRQIPRWLHDKIKTETGYTRWPKGIAE